jgi:hypothetical protein
VRRQEVSHLGYPGAETPKLIYPLNSLRGFTSHDFAMCDDKRSPIWVSREPKLRSSYISTLSYFGVPQSGFRDVRVQEVLHLGFPVAETPKHQNLSTLDYFGVPHIGISRLASTRKLTLGFPGCRNTETPKPIHARLFRGSTYRDFASGEYKETYPWVSRLPKLRNTNIFGNHSFWCKVSKLRP